MPAEKKEGEKAHEEIVGLIARNPGELRPLSGNDLKNGALVIVLNDLEAHPVIVGEADFEGQPEA